MLCRKSSQVISCCHISSQEKLVVFYTVVPIIASLKNNKNSWILNLQLTLDSCRLFYLHCLRVCRVDNNCNTGVCVYYKIAVVVRQHRDGNDFDTCGQTIKCHITILYEYIYACPLFFCW